MCDLYAWCDVDHNDPVEESLDSPDVWHRELAIEEESVGVLRTDHVLDPRGAHLSVNEMFDWLIPESDTPEFFARIRASIDEAEQRFQEFVERVKA